MEIVWKYYLFGVNLTTPEDLTLHQISTQEKMFLTMMLPSSRWVQVCPDLSVGFVS